MKLDTMVVLHDVYGERLRQIGKGFTAEHDEQHRGNSDLVEAACAYALHATDIGPNQDLADDLYPWETRSATFSPTGHRYEKVIKALALLTAHAEQLREEMNAGRVAMEFVQPGEPEVLRRHRSGAQPRYFGND